MEGPVLDDVIRRLLSGGGKQVQLFEAEMRQLCVEAKKVFLSQPNLLELHAPIKICGQFGILPIPRVDLQLNLVQLPFCQ
ncbi:hypothetical protein BHE74_00047758 [Ensete ventricosum]|nr:hypothetical protein BHE74_00047758 [Ensete ventricosum]